MNRRDLLNVGGLIAASTALGSFRVSAAQTTAPSPYGPAFALLNRFVEEYLADMNAPGLTLALADASGVQRVCTYGLDDLARHTPLNVDQLFHIGSISKSFLAICLLQLRDEGQLDLHRPLEQYLPWLRFDGLGRSLTAHDLLTHSGGLPDGPLFPTDRRLGSLRLHRVHRPRHGRVSHHAHQSRHDAPRAHSLRGRLRVVLRGVHLRRRVRERRLLWLWHRRG